eukprot:14831289-Alexandrium_andersonii.AAC.1
MEVLARCWYCRKSSWSHAWRTCLSKGCRRCEPEAYRQCMALYEPQLRWLESGYDMRSRGSKAVGRGKGKGAGKGTARPLVRAQGNVKPKPKPL